MKNKKQLLTNLYNENLKLSINYDLINEFKTKQLELTNEIKINKI